MCSVPFLYTPSSAYLVLPLNSTPNYGHLTGLSVPLIFKGKESSLYIEKCQLFQYIQIAEHCTPTSHMKQGGGLPESHW